jgi:hypothetical protein
MTLPNKTQEILFDGRVVLRSYDTPVAAHIPGVGYVQTERKYSVTTSRHVNQFTHKRAKVVPHEEFLRLIA